jgi:hypothetical protein
VATQDAEDDDENGSPEETTGRVACGQGAATRRPGCASSTKRLRATFMPIPSNAITTNAA